MKNELEILAELNQQYTKFVSRAGSHRSGLEAAFGLLGGVPAAPTPGPRKRFLDAHGASFRAISGGLRPTISISWRASHSPNVWRGTLTALARLDRCYLPYIAFTGGVNGLEKTD